MDGCFEWVWTDLVDDLEFLARPDELRFRYRGLETGEGLVVELLYPLISNIGLGKQFSHVLSELAS